MAFEMCVICGEVTSGSALGRFAFMSHTVRNTAEG